MRAVDIIRKKRNGGALSGPEIAFLIEGSIKGQVPDYQLSALLMAVYCNGMSAEETVALTSAMVSSGVKLETGSIQGVKIDKHSTGGVGDKTLIILAPLMAAMGLKMPSIAGRGLGHTGGTIDKLSSIPGFRTDLGTEELAECLKTAGFFINGQTDQINPADKKIYALRDATSTVESIPLIAASIMSKKLSEGIDALVLDVKTGSGALTKGLEEARELANLMVRIGTSMGVTTIALVTDMDVPLGRSVGNALELKECISALKGNFAPDLMEITMTLAAWMLHLADVVSEETVPQRLGENLLKRYKDEIWDYIDHGDAFAKLIECVDAQHGNADAVLNPALLPAAGHIKPVISPWKGYITRMDAFAVGQASMLLGAGRGTNDDIDPAAGIIIGKKPGDAVNAETPFATLHTNDPSRLKEAEEVFLSGIEIGDREPLKRKLIHEVIFPE